jgi:hypothetical protein
MAPAISFTTVPGFDAAARPADEEHRTQAAFVHGAFDSFMPPFQRHAFGPLSEK